MRPGFVYTLHNSIYIPLTCFSNTVTLPATRGPSFCLPPTVLTALHSVRSVEVTQDTSSITTSPDKLSRLSSLKVSKYPYADERNRHPTAEELFEELEENYPNMAFDSIVISGEGEPTLRLDTLKALVSKIKTAHSKIPIRLTTNGLIPEEHVDEVLSSRIDAVSIAIMTHDSQKYDLLMEPAIPHAHTRVCDFVSRAVKAQLEVEVTAVLRQDIDKDRTQQLASRLQAGPVRWRTYFP